MGIRKVKAIELVLDWNLWPRQSAERLDSANVSRMREALRSGFELPPVVVNEKDMRVVDGFHRTRAHLDVFGDEAEIKADVRQFKDEAEIFLAAGRYNSAHGKPMGPKDRAHFFLKCRKMKIPPAAIADVLSTDVESLKKFIAERTAKTEEGETIPLSYGARSLAGKTLTRAQEHYQRKSDGNVPEAHISMLLNALTSDSVTLTERTIARLRELADVIEQILDEAA